MEHNLNLIILIFIKQIKKKNENINLNIIWKQLNKKKFIKK